MHQNTGEIYERNDSGEWEKTEDAVVNANQSLAERLSEGEMQEMIAAGRMTTGPKHDLMRMRKIKRLSMGTKNQKKKARQMRRDSRKKNRRK